MPAASVGSPNETPPVAGPHQQACIPRSCVEPLDPEPVDETHPIPDLGVIVGSPLGAGARSIYRFARKLDGYLQYLNSSRHPEKFGRSTVQTAAITVHFHPRSDPQVERIPGGRCRLGAAAQSRRRLRA
jgi:hypothetical protein